MKTKIKTIILIWWLIGYITVLYDYSEVHDVSVSSAVAFIPVGIMGPVYPIMSFFQERGFEIILIKKRSGGE